MPKRKITPKAAFERLQKIDPNAEIEWDEKTAAPRHVRGKLSGPQQGEPEAIAKRFLDENKELLSMDGPGEELQLKRVGADARGNTHIRYQQVYKGLPVFARDLVVHLTSENVVQGVDGTYVPGIGVSTDPKITSEEATQIVLKDAPDNKRAPETEPVLLIFIHEDKSHLAWHMSMEGTDKGLDGSETEALWAYFVDAHTGDVIWRYNNLQTHGPTTGSGTGLYGGAMTLNTVHNHVANEWELEDRWVPSTARIYTHDAANGFPPQPVSVDNNNDWSAGDQGQEVDCHAFTRAVFDYFLTMHGRNGINGAGADMHIYAHVGVNWNNASWNGSHVKIGDGDGATYGPFSTLDIVAHEWTHAVTTYEANLIYFGESGAINESMSDVFAALIDGDWLQGEDNWLNTAQAPAGRNLADPTNGGQYNTADPIGSVLSGHQPDHYNDRYTGPLDNQGVHINSGIVNKAAYLIAVGGMHRGIRICDGLGREVLGRLYYNALTNHLTNSSNFADLRQAVLDSLDDLYLGDPRYTKWRVSINNAFAAVGIGTAQLCPPIFFCPPAPIILCPPGPITLCPPGPIIQCQPAPIIQCQPGPLALCPPAPIIQCPPGPILQCPSAPIIGCLPGPDPAPFTPRIDKLKLPAKKRTPRRATAKKTVTKKSTRGRSR